MKLVAPAILRPLIEPNLPDDIDAEWFFSLDEALKLAPNAEIGWLDHYGPSGWADIVARATKLKWLNTIFAGLDALDLPTLSARGTIVTNGRGINAIAVAEYAVMGVLVAAKRFDRVVRRADTHQWVHDAPGKIELFDSRALIIGMGAIGTMIADRLRAFGVHVTGVTHSGRDGTLTPNRWKARIGEFDWIILAAPSTPETRGMIGEAELHAMQRTAWIVNVARGDMIDQDALVVALNDNVIGGAFLDAVTPEPLPPTDPLWTANNAIHTMHLSGRSQTLMFQRAATLFLDNLAAFRAGKPMRNVADLNAGY